MRLLDGITDSMDMGLRQFREMGKEREAWCASVHWVEKSWTQLSNNKKTAYQYTDEKDPVKRED